MTLIIFHIIFFILCREFETKTLLFQYITVSLDLQQGKGLMTIPSTTINERRGKKRAKKGVAKGGNELIALRQRVAGRTADRSRLPVPVTPSSSFEVFVVPIESRTWAIAEGTRECRPLSRKIFIFVPARHGRRTKGTETAFPQILRSFLPDRLHTRGYFDTKYRFYCAAKRTRTPLFDRPFPRNLFENFCVTWEIISKLSFFFFYKCHRILC